MNYVPLSEERLSLSGGASYMRCPDNAILVLIQAEAQAIRIRFCGSNPSASSGFLLEAGQSFEYNGDASKIRLAAAAPGAIANIVYFAPRS